MNDLSIYIKEIRERNNHSVRAMAKILGVSSGYISQIENSKEKPSKKFLQSFSFANSLTTQETTHLFRLAGYPVQGIVSSGGVQRQGEEVIKMSTNDKEISSKHNTMPQQKQTEMQVKVKDGQYVLYSDIAIVNSNPYGITINFGQMLGGNSMQAEVATRVGLSFEHAEALIKAIQQEVMRSKIKTKKTGHQA